VQVISKEQIVSEVQIVSKVQVCARRQPELAVQQSDGWVVVVVSEPVGLRPDAMILLGIW
jgi:hypothetical protein